MPAVSGTLNCPGDAMKKRGGRVSVRRTLGWDFGAEAASRPPAPGSAGGLWERGPAGPLLGSGGRPASRPGFDQPGPQSSPSTREHRAIGPDRYTTLAKELRE